MDGMTLLIFHIFAIGVIIATTAIIAYIIPGKIEEGFCQKTRTKKILQRK